MSQPGWSAIGGAPKGPRALCDDKRRRMNPRMKIQLVPPTERYRESFLRGLREFRHEGLPWWVGGDLETAEQDFAAFVARKLADSNRRNEPFVPKTHLWAVTEEQFVGRISIHHELNDALRVEGGHIGYDTVPSFRGRGVATEMLRQALPVARAPCLTLVLFSCCAPQLDATPVV